MNLLKNKINENVNLFFNYLGITIFYLIFSIFIPYLFLYIFVTSITGLIYLIYVERKKQEQKVILSYFYKIRTLILLVLISTLLVFLSPYDVIFDLSHDKFMSIVVINDYKSTKLTFVFIALIPQPLNLMVFHAILNQSSDCSWISKDNNLYIEFKNRFYSECLFIDLSNLISIEFPIQSNFHQFFFKRQVAIFGYENRVKRKYCISLQKFDIWEVLLILSDLSENPTLNILYHQNFSEQLVYALSANKLISKFQLNEKNYSSKLNVKEKLERKINSNCEIIYLNKLVIFPLLLIFLSIFFISILSVIALISIFEMDIPYFPVDEKFNNAQVGIFLAIIFGMFELSISPIYKFTIRVLGKTKLTVKDDMLILNVKWLRFTYTEFNFPISFLRILEYDKFSILDVKTYKIKILDK